MNNPILIIFIILFSIVSGYMMLSYNSSEPESEVNKVAAQSKIIDEDKAVVGSSLDNETAAPAIQNNIVDLNIKNIESFKIEEQTKCSESQKQAGLTEEYASLWCTCMVEAVISKFGANEYINVMRDESRFSDFALKCQNSVLLDTRGPETSVDR